MTAVYVLIGVVVIALAIIVYLVYKNKNQNYSNRDQNPPTTEVKSEDIKALAQYVEAQKRQAEETQRLKDFKKADMKEKLETFKQTKIELKEQLKSQLSAKEWAPLKSILNKVDKAQWAFMCYITKQKINIM